jgi:phospholipid/cholesterol/gamma-HCH transport system permease protein
MTLRTSARRSYANPTASPTWYHGRPMRDWAPSRLLEALGARAIAWLEFARDLFQFFVRAGVAVIFSGTQGLSVIRETTFRQIFFTGVQALPVVGLLALVLGGVIIVQTTSYLSAGGVAVVGSLMDLLVIRQLGPLMTAVIVIGRSGSAVTVELGNMKVRGEMELLEAMGIDPMRYLVIPRMAGMTYAVMVLCVIFDIIAMLGGCMVASVILDAPMVSLVSAIGAEVTLSAVSVGLVKSATFGLVIATLSTYHGMSQGPAPTMVPVATMRSVVNSLVVCVVVNAVITLFFYSEVLL